MSVRGASKHYHVSKETLKQRITGTMTVDGKAGHSNFLTKEQEKEIVQIFQMFAEWRFWLREVDMLNVVTDFL